MMEKRFVNFKNRKYKQDIDKIEFKILQDIKNNFSYRGVEFLKDPYSQIMYKKLITEMKPKTIIELGTWKGGSALYFNDICNLLKLDTKIYTFDINTEQVKVKNNKNIIVGKYVAGEPKKYLEKTFKNLKHPVLITEDAHRGIPELLLFVDKYLKVGDYIVVEDTFEYIMDSNSRHSQKLYKKYFDFMENNKSFTDRYYVDSKYCDLIGYNSTWNSNSILKKIK